MFERFTDQARRTVVLAQEEARGLDHGFIGTEHLLLGLLHPPGAAAAALESSGITLEMARERITEMIGRGKQPPSGHVPFTPRAKKVLELSHQESRELGDRAIKSGHLLLAILREGKGVAAQVIIAAGADPGELRDRVTGLLLDEPDETMKLTATAVVSGRLTGPRQPLRESWERILPVLDSIEARLDAIEQHLGISSDELAALRQADQQIAEIRRDKEAAIDAQDFEKAAALREQEKRVLSERARLQKDLSDTGDQPGAPGTGESAG